MTLNTLEAAIATLAFLGPGALFYFTVSMFFPQRLERQQKHHSSISRLQCHQLCYMVLGHLSYCHTFVIFGTSYPHGSDMVCHYLR